MATPFENNNAYEHMRTSTIKSALEKNTYLPLHGVTATVPQEVRIDSLEPVITGIDPRILFHARLKRLLEELDDWPEKQDDHHFDGLVALHLLWMIAVSRGSGIPRAASKKSGKRDIYKGYD